MADQATAFAREEDRATLVADGIVRNEKTTPVNRTRGGFGRAAWSPAPLSPLSAETDPRRDAVGAIPRSAGINHSSSTLG